MKRKRDQLKKPLLIFCFVFLSLLGRNGMAAEPSMADYTAYPLFQVSNVLPNILIILDNSDSMNFQAYNGPYDHNTKYYGYFEPYKRYRYGSGIFVRDNSGLWDGNFLNWLTMRRIDVTRKVLMGGLATSRLGTGNQTNIGEAPPAGFDFVKDYVDTDDVTPFDSITNFSYLVDGGNFYVNGSTYTIKVDKNMNTYPDEAYGFVDGNIAGVLQRIGDRARWGNEFFNYGTGANASGGTIVSTIGTNMTSLITDLQNTACDTKTPLAEAYYVAMQYFKQEDPQAGLDYPNNAVPNSNLGDDPYYNGSELVHCAKSFVILLTDGLSSLDKMIPDFLKDADNDGNDTTFYADSGSDYLDDVAFYARTHDLRIDLDGDQNLILYTIYAFGTEPEAEQLLKDAARNGGFVEKNGVTGPDLQAEWDSNGDGDPDNYYRADNGYELEANILKAVNDILERAASGTAVSVLATSGEGEGNLFQAYYRPLLTKDLEEYRWLGYLQSLWVDPRGYLREDTITDLTLDLETDRVITYFVDGGSGDTKIKRFNVSPAHPYPDLNNDPYEIVDLNEIIPLWEAGRRLAQRYDYTFPRKIFTYLDKDGDGEVDEKVNNPFDNPFDDNGEVVRFHTASAASIKPYLGVKNDAAWSYLGADHDTRVNNVINYIRGEDIPGLRLRTSDGIYVWKLGDIVHSTPVSVSRAPENFDLIYRDASYLAFANDVRARENIVFVGANDGMLHAFTSWQYDASLWKYTKPAGADTSEQIGDEIWAYIPQSLLPHLKWLPSPTYTHVYYMDLKPKVFDAKILPDDTHYTDADSDDNWGTFLLLGLNMGGKHITAAGDFNNDGTDTEIRDFYPTYTLLDVTEPRHPRLIWERSYADLEMSHSLPAVLKVKNNWFAVFGSGPSDYDGTSTKKGHIFVVDLKTGAPYKSGTNDWLFETAESNAFMNSPVALDKQLNFSVDALYLGETYYASSNWKGKMYKVTIPWVDAFGVYDGSDTANYLENPLDAANPWQLSALFDATRPITASVTLSRDVYDNVWIYGGTGRFLSTADKSNTDTQYLFGIKDPFFNRDHTPGGLYGDNYYHNYADSLELGMTDLLDGDSYIITTSKEAFDNGTSVGNWENMLAIARAKDGWVRSLGIPKERALNKPTILGGTVFTPSFVPSDDLCASGGESYLYGVYYETGTAYYEPAFDQGTTTVSIDGVDKEQVLDWTSLGTGMSASLGIHVGNEQGATGFVQQSTGSIQIEGLNPALGVKSCLRSWQEK